MCKRTYGVSLGYDPTIAPSRLIDHLSNGEKGGSGRQAGSYVDIVSLSHYHTSEFKCSLTEIDDATVLYMPMSVVQNGAPPLGSLM